MMIQATPPILLRTCVGATQALTTSGQPLKQFAAGLAGTLNPWLPATWYAHDRHVRVVARLRAIQAFPVTRSPRKRYTAVLAGSGNACHRIMQTHVFGMRHDLQVLNAIVAGIAVDVVDVFIGSKRSSKMLRHDKSMFEHVSIVSPQMNVAIGILPRLTLGEIPTLLGAEASLSLTWKVVEYRAAVFAYALLPLVTSSILCMHSGVSPTRHSGVSCLGGLPSCRGFSRGSIIAEIRAIPGF